MPNVIDVSGAGNYRTMLFAPNGYEDFRPIGQEELTATNMNLNLLHINALEKVYQTGDDVHKNLDLSLTTLASMGMMTAEHFASSAMSFAQSIMSMMTTLVAESNKNQQSSMLPLGLSGLFGGGGGGGIGDILGSVMSIFGL